MNNYVKFNPNRFTPDPKVPNLKKLIGEMDKKKSVSKLKKELDKVFNAFIRARDTSGKQFTCISCNTIKPLKQLQAGHFYSCEFTAVRWDEKNVNGQCISCNIFDQGNFPGYLKGMIKKYGQTTVDILDVKKNNKAKMSAFEYEILISEYKEKIKTLKQ